MCNISQIFSNVIGDNPERIHYFKARADALMKSHAPHTENLFTFTTDQEFDTQDLAKTSSLSAKQQQLCDEVLYQV